MQCEPLIDMVDAAYKAYESNKELLKARSLGGVTRESAEKAIKTGAVEVAEKARDLISTLSQGYAESINKHMSELAEMTSLKDEFVKKAAKAAEETDAIKAKLNTATEEISVLKQTKVGKSKTLPNGNIETVKVNKNGARMTVETLPDGKVVSTKVENIDGDVRKTFFDPTTGKPTKTYTNVNEERLIEYTPNGMKVSRVNNKKVLPKKPEVLSQEIIQGDAASGNYVAKQVYSDGSYETIDCYSHVPVKIQKYNAKNQIISETRYNRKDGNIIKYVQEFNPVTSRVISETTYNESKKLAPHKILLGKKLYTDDGKILIEENIKYVSGLSSTRKAHKSDYGVYDPNLVSIRHKYPKDSAIKSSTIKYTDPFYPAIIEEIKLKDGRKIIATINDNYQPIKLQVISKDGSEQVIEHASEAIPYLEKLGYLGTDNNINSQYFKRYLY